MKYKPLNDEEIIALKPILQPGTYQFEAVGAEDTRSKKTNKEMIKATLKVWADQGKEFYLTDYFTGDEKMIWKLKSYFDCVGQLNLYETGEISANNFNHTSGFVKTKVKTDEYGTQAVVVGYIKKSDQDIIPTNQAPKAASTDTKIDFEEDDLPF